MGAELALGKTELEARDAVRGQAEAAAQQLLGAHPPRKVADRAMFGGDFGAGHWKVLRGGGGGLLIIRSFRTPSIFDRTRHLWQVLCETGTAVVMDYNIFHRGCRSEPPRGRLAPIFR